MGTTAALRLLAGLFTFSVVARLLGPEAFGVLMLWLSVSALVTIFTNYGLTPYVLREMGAHPESAELIINEGLTGKLILAATVIVLSIAAAFIFQMDHKQVFFSLLFAALADCFTEFLNAGFRARSRFEVETKIATLSAMTHATIVCGAVLLSPTIETVAGAYAVSRLLVLLITVPAVARNFAAPQLVTISAAFARLRKAISYAIDFGFQSLFGQVDSVVLNAAIGPAAVGLHQAGMRLFLGGAQVAPILANVFLPRAAATAKSKAGFSKECRRIQFAFLACGALFGLALAVFAQPLVAILFGASYQKLVSLMPYFGLLFFLRFASGAWGLVHTAAGKQTFRMQISIVQWGVIGLAGWLLVPSYGNRGWLVALCAGTIVQGLIYAVRGRALIERSWDILGFTTTGILIFLPQLDME
jgi:O-antigen/teichoic acid export membrane protein